MNRLNHSQYKALIMKRAWELVKDDPFGLTSLSQALKIAWTEYRDWEESNETLAEFDFDYSKFNGVSDLSGVMRRAWQLRLAYALTMSIAMRIAWQDLRDVQAMARDKAQYKAQGVSEIERALRDSSTLGRVKHLGRIKARSRATIAERAFYPDDISGLNNAFSAKGGLAPDFMAEAIGFSTTCQLWKALRNELGQIKLTIKQLRAA
jgi:hypothetical protein